MSSSTTITSSAGGLNFGLRDRTFIVTGAAKGIGAACCTRLSAEGARVALWDMDVAAAQALAERLRAGGAQVQAMPAAPKLAWRRIPLGGLAIRCWVTKGAATVAVERVLRKERRFSW